MARRRRGPSFPEALKEKDPEERERAAETTEANEAMKERAGRPRHEPPLGSNPGATTVGSPD